ncbi:hypothetical protein PG994_012500 [Apiospora phragmitis]|uniref:Uncharacterized protein n=1 Tax=Apiospora phragmitis TaxID=2905665 RepID=A0ABR1TVS9_9PEZI
MTPEGQSSSAAVAQPPAQQGQTALETAVILQVFSPEHPNAYPPVSRQRGNVADYQATMSGLGERRSPRTGRDRGGVSLDELKSLLGITGVGNGNNDTDMGSGSGSDNGNNDVDMVSNPGITASDSNNPFLVQPPPLRPDGATPAPFVPMDPADVERDRNSMLVVAGPPPPAPRPAPARLVSVERQPENGVQFWIHPSANAAAAAAAANNGLVAADRPRNSPYFFLYPGLRGGGDANAAGNGQLQAQMLVLAREPPVRSGLSPTAEPIILWGQADGGVRQPLRFPFNRWPRGRTARERGSPEPLDGDGDVDVGGRPREGGGGGNRPGLRQKFRNKCALS